MLYLVSTIKKLAFAFVVAAFLLCLQANSAQATDASDVQPASDVVYGERLRVNSAISVADSSYYYKGIHLGSADGTGGVIFANGSIINGSTANKPVTFGDDVRIDGGIWRGPNAGTGDGLPVKISDDLRVDGEIWAGYSPGNAIDGQSVVFADSVRPAMDNINAFGSNGYRWASGDFAGTVNVGNLGGDDVVNENNLQSTNAPTAGYILSYVGNNEFRWVPASDSSVLTNLSCTNGQVIKYNGTAWVCGSDNTGSNDTDWTGAGTGTMYATSTSDDVGIGVTSGLSGKLHVAETGSNGTSIYAAAEYIGVEGNTVRGASQGISAGVVGASQLSAGAITITGNTGGFFTSDDGDGGYGAYGEVTGTGVGTSFGGYFTAASTTANGVYGLASSPTGVNYGGYFDSDSATGTGVYGTSYLIGVSGYVTPGGGATYSAAVRGLADTGSIYGVTAPSVSVGGDFATDSGTGVGVYGQAVHETGLNYGGYFTSASSGGYGVEARGGTYGVKGTATGSIGPTYGGYFHSDDDVGYGVYGYAADDSGTNYGGYFESEGSTGYGVYGLADDNSDVNYGGYFETDSPTGYGAYGLADSGGAGTSWGGYFKSESTIGIGVYGEAAKTGNYTNYGGYFSAAGDTSRAVYGYASGASGHGGSFRTGVAASSGVAVYGLSGHISGYSGQFAGGNFQVDLASGANFYADLPSQASAGTFEDVYLDKNGANYLYTVTSSLRYKENVRDLEINTENVLDLRPVKYTSKSDGKEGVGLIAEEVYDIIPELVGLDKEGKPHSVNYDNIPLYNIGVIKENRQKLIDQQDIISEQQNKIADRENQINDQQSKISTLEDEVSGLKSVLCKYLPKEEICQE